MDSSGSSGRQHLNLVDLDAGSGGAVDGHHSGGGEARPLHLPVAGSGEGVVPAGLVPAGALVEVVAAGGTTEVHPPLPGVVGAPGAGERGAVAHVPGDLGDLG